MAHPPSPRSPYFDWPLDGWKIGVAALLFVGLGFWWWMGIDAPVAEEIDFPLPLTTSQAASFGSNPPAAIATIAEPSLALTVDALVAAIASTPTSDAVASLPYDLDSTGEGTITPVTTPTVAPTATPAQIAVTATVTATPAAAPTSIPAGITTPSSPLSLTFEVLSSVETPLTNSRPALFGRANPGAILVIDVEEKRFLVEADTAGEWIFVSPAPLPTGTTEVRVGFLGPGGRGQRDVQAYNLQVAEDAQPIPPPTLDLLPSETLTTTPSLTGRAPAGMVIQIWTRALSADESIPLGESISGEDGRWSAQPNVDLPPGDYSVWVLLVDEEARPLSRSAAQRMSIDAAQP